MTTQPSPLLDRLRAATLGRYDIYAELGHGGMATVFLALDLALDRKVAIKVLDPQHGASSEAMERFRREAKVAASLTHPNIIVIHAVGDDPELAFFVMKYVEGRSLDSVVRETGPQDVAFVRGVVAAAGRALHYAHTRGVVHRDVKPANFMLDTDGWLIVTDFGIAKRDDAHGLTLTGAIVGTPYYMAPEQFTGAPITAAADQYALGVVAFELLTGKQPFHGATIGEVMRGHLLDPIPAISSMRPDVPAHIESAITRMLAKDPNDRFPTLEAAVEAFGSVSTTLEEEVRTQIVHLAQSGAMRQPRVAAPVGPAPVSHRRRTIVLVTLGLLVGVLGATAALRPDLVNRYRKVLFGPTGDAADTAAIVRGTSGQFAPGEPEGVESASPETIPQSFVYGTIVVGTRCANAELYAGESRLDAPRRSGVQEVLQVAGPVRLSIRSGATVMWDTTFAVSAGMRHDIGARPLRCPP